jgi:hypothetical protein
MRKSESSDYVLRDRPRFDASRPVWVTTDPNASLKTLYGQRAVCTYQAMTNIEAASPELGNCALNSHLIPIRAGDVELCSRVDERDANDVVPLDHRGFRHTKGLSEKGGGSGIEPFKVSGVEHDPGGIAIAPFD